MILLIILVEEFSKMVSARFDGSRTLLSLSTGTFFFKSSFAKIRVSNVSACPHFKVNVTL